MRSLWVAFVVCAILVAFSSSAKYTTRYDHIDLENILSSDRLLKHYFDCLMDRGPCTPDGAELRRNIEDALKTECSKCSETQKSKAKKALDFMEKNKKDMIHELEEKYDPEGIYRKREDKRQNELKAKDKI